MSNVPNLLKVSVSATLENELLHYLSISRAMPPTSRQSLIQALFKQMPEPSSPAVIVVRPDRSGPVPVQTNGHRTNPLKPTYDPSIVFVLELATIVATRDHESVSLMGQAVADALQSVVRDAANVHPLALARAVFYLLYLLNASQVSLQTRFKLMHLLKISKDHSFVRAPVILHTIAGYDPSILEKTSMLILDGLTLCIQNPSPLRKEITNTPDFWSIVRSLHALPEVAGKAFDLVASLVAGQQAAVTADNYKDTVSLLNDFAAAGSVGAVVEQTRDKTGRRTTEKVMKSAKPR